MNTSTFTLTAEQERICGLVTTRNNLFINAAAGSAKSSTAKVYSQDFNRYRALYTTFNTHNIEAAKKAGVNADCSSLHSVGYQALKYFLRGRQVQIKLNPHKASTIFKQLKNEDPRLKRLSLYSFETVWDMWRILNKSWTGQEMQDMSSLDDVLERVGTELRVDFFGWIGRAEEMNTELTLEGCIDYPDMVYMPQRLLQPNWMKVDQVVVDECFDLMPAAIAMLEHGLHPRAQRIYCGDIDQCIYHKFGASGDAILAQVKGWETASLTKTFRCRGDIGRLAQQFCNHIEPFFEDGGTVMESKEMVKPDDLKKGSLVISSKYANLIPLYVQTITAGKLAHMRGVELLADVAKNIESEYKKTRNWDSSIASVLSNFSEKLDAMPITKSNEERRKLLERKIDVTSHLAACFDCADEMMRVIGRACDIKESSADIIFSSIHRSKGCEADDVVFIGYSELLNNWELSEYQDDEIRKLLYVGVTRAKYYLTLI